MKGYISSLAMLFIAGLIMFSSVYFIEKNNEERSMRRRAVVVVEKFENGNVFIRNKYGEKRTISTTNKNFLLINLKKCTTTQFSPNDTIMVVNFE